MTLSRTNPRAKPRWLLLAAAVVGMLVLVSGTALAVLPSTQGVFELDGNAVNDPAVAGDDWSNLWENCPAGTNSTVAANFVECSFIGQSSEGLGSDISYFTGGGSKDVNNVSQWRYNGNSVPDKNQITNAYAAQYSKDGRQLIYFGADRYSNDGDSSLGFWFFKGSVSLGANGTFVGNHEDGDLFIVSDFSNGGSVGTVVAYRWTGGANGSLTGPIGQGGDCTTAPATANVCARVNGAPTPAPWPYTPKPNVGSPGTFPTNTFFEGGIDLTALAGGQTCFSSFLAETRSSTSTTAQLKDFALGGFDTCDARISISPSGVNAVGTDHDFTVKVERSFGGTFEGVSGVTVNGSLTTDSTVPPSALTTATCTTNSSGECTLTVNSATAGVAVVSATAEVSFPGAGSETVTTNGQNGSSNPATKRFVDATITIGQTAVNAVGNPHTFNITVTPHLAGTTVSAITITPEITGSPDPTITNNTCPAVTATGPYTCSITINSTQAATYTANASTTVTFSGTGNPSSAQVTRSTSGNSGPGGSGPATKRFVDARIKIEPPLDTNGIGESHTVTVTVEKNLGAGAGWEPLAGATPAVTLTPSGGAVVANNKVDNCASPNGTGSNGECTVTFTSNSAGTVTGTASVTVTLDGQSITRSTAAAHSGNAATSAVKHFIAGTLKWLKHDQDGNLLGGATFEVCRTHILDSSTNPDSFTLLTPSDCFSVTDNSAPDADNTAGKLQLNNLILGKYTITETAAPEGYAKSSATLNATLDLSNLPASATAEAGTFVNVRLFKMIVITCNQSTDELVLSTVTLSGHSGSPKDTLVAADLPNGVTAAQLCNLAGANYGNLNAGTYTPSVVIPKPPQPGP